MIKLQKEISEMESKAEENINSDKTRVKMAESELKKVPKETLDKLPKVPGEAGYRFVSLKRSDTGPVMKFIDSEDARKRLDFASNNVNAKDNVPLIEKLTEKRQELAELMGYSSYTELTLKDKMAKAPQAVEKLLDDLTHRISK